MSFGEQLLATLVGGGIAVVAGVVVQWLAARHEREEANKAWERQRRDVRADVRRTAVIELQDALRRFRGAVISLADADILVREVREPRAQRRSRTTEEILAESAAVANWPELQREHFAKRDDLKMAISRVTSYEMREAAGAAETALIDAFGSEHLGQVRQAVERAEEALAKSTTS